MPPLASQAEHTNISPVIDRKLWRSRTDSEATDLRNRSRTSRDSARAESKQCNSEPKTSTAAGLQVDHYESQL